MIRRQIDLDEETDRLLADLAEDYGGDRGKALADLIQVHVGLETIAEQSEEVHQALLQAQVERSERDFKEGRVISWDEVKRRHRL